MPRVASYETFYGIYDAYLRNAPNGSVARYAMAHPGVYPVDRPYVDALRKDPDAPPLVAERFIETARYLLRREVSLQRLIVVYGPGERDHDPQYLRILQRSFAEMNASGLETSRVAWYGQQIGRLVAVCGEESPLVKRYRLGAESGVPKAGLWTVLYPELDEPKAIAVMNYSDEPGHPFESADIWEAPYPPELLDLSRFWGLVFDDVEQSMDLQAV